MKNKQLIVIRNLISLFILKWCRAHGKINEWSPRMDPSITDENSIYQPVVVVVTITCFFSCCFCIHLIRPKAPLASSKNHLAGTSEQHSSAALTHSHCDEKRKLCSIIFILYTVILSQPLGNLKRETQGRKEYENREWKCKWEST